MWQVDLINRDGTDRLRVRQYGWFYAEVTTPEALAAIVPLAELRSPR